MKRETWGSKLGFIFAAAGSAVGLANIWRFPYIVGSSGGGIFVIIYLICLVLIGFPVFIAEVLIGRTTHLSPAGAFLKLGKSKLWGFVGKIIILTGFIVSAFYSSVAAWILGYLIEAFVGNITHFANAGDALDYFGALTGNPYWCLFFHFLFLALCTTILLCGVRKGIEKGNKLLMPLLYVVLIILVIKALTMPNSWSGIYYLFHPDWSELKPSTFLLALGQAFFTLSLGQGTMVTYGSYLTHKDNLLTSCIPVALMDTFVSLFSAIAVFGIVFSVGLEPNAGPGLIFQTLPLVFSKVPAGYLLAIMFFMLVFLASVTSEISAMEPAVAYLIDNHGFNRKKATLVVACGAFLLGVPCAFSTNILESYKVSGFTFFDLLESLSTGILIPLGGFAAVVLVGWSWGERKAIEHLQDGAEGMMGKYPILSAYFRVCFKYVTPILILFVFLNAIGVFG